MNGEQAGKTSEFYEVGAVKSKAAPDADCHEVEGCLLSKAQHAHVRLWYVHQVPVHHMPAAQHCLT